MQQVYRKINLLLFMPDEVRYGVFLDDLEPTVTFQLVKVDVYVYEPGEGEDCPFEGAEVGYIDNADYGYPLEFWEFGVADAEGAATGDLLPISFCFAVSGELYEGEFSFSNEKAQHVGDDPFVEFSIWDEDFDCGYE